MIWVCQNLNLKRDTDLNDMLNRTVSGVIHYFKSIIGNRLMRWMLFTYRVWSGNELSYGVGNFNCVICSRERWQDVTYEREKKKKKVMPCPFILIKIISFVLHFSPFTLNVNIAILIFLITLSVDVTLLWCHKWLKSQRWHLYDFVVPLWIYPHLALPSPWPVFESFSPRHKMRHISDFIQRFIFKVTWRYPFITVAFVS